MNAIITSNRNDGGREGELSLKEGRETWPLVNSTVKYQRSSQEIESRVVVLRSMHSVNTAIL